MVEGLRVQAAQLAVKLHVWNTTFTVKNVLQNVCVTSQRLCVTHNIDFFIDSHLKSSQLDSVVLSST